MKLCDKIPAITTCSAKDKLSVFIATGSGLGLCPVAPGTSGSLLGILFAWFVSKVDIYYGVTIIILIVIIAVTTAGITARIMRQKDPRLIVADEVAGMTIALAWIPFTPANILIQLILFRGLDIWKPSLIGWLDKNLPGGWGIVMDDVLAGVVANMIWNIIHFSLIML
jgi:phosphatidylglycerophosphatase A